MRGNPAAESWPALWTLFAGYFHEDFVDDHGTADGTLEAFVADEPSEYVGTAKREARALADSDATEDELQETVGRLGLCYAYRVDGWTCRGWLQHVAEVLAER